MIIIGNNNNSMNSAILHKYFNLSEYESEKMIQLIDVYSFWNGKVNLISRKDFHYFYERHVLHSLAIKATTFQKCAILSALELSIQFW